jgi:hypothetical protein
MSRNPINEEILSLGNQLRKGMDSLTIMDPGRLRVPMGGGCKTHKKQSWMTVSGSTNFNSPNEEADAMFDVVMDIPRSNKGVQSSVFPALELNNFNLGSYNWQVHGGLLALGYTAFGMGLALCNLLAPQHTSKVCTALSPIPLICLLVQALTCMELGHRHLGPGGLLLSALLLPSACVFWILQVSIPVVGLLSLSVFYCMRHRNLLSWVCFSGVCLCLLLAIPVPIIQILEPRWGMTVAMFFACILCFLAGLGGGVGIQIKLL